jgi:hypothetical protein
LRRPSSVPTSTPKLDHHNMLHPQRWMTQRCAPTNSFPHRRLPSLLVRYPTIGLAPPQLLVDSGETRAPSFETWVSVLRNERTCCDWGLCVLMCHDTVTRSISPRAKGSCFPPFHVRLNRRYVAASLFGSSKHRLSENVAPFYFHTCTSLQGLCWPVIIVRSATHMSSFPPLSRFTLAGHWVQHGTCRCQTDK